MLTGTVAADDVFVLAAGSASAVRSLAAADQSDQLRAFYNGDDAVALVKGDAIVDVIGQIGVDPGTRVGLGTHVDVRQHAAARTPTRASATPTARTPSIRPRAGSGSPPTPSTGSAPTTPTARSSPEPTPILTPNRILTPSRPRSRTATSTP